MEYLCYKRRYCATFKLYSYQKINFTTFITFVNDS